MRFIRVWIPLFLFSELIILNPCLTNDRFILFRGTKSQIVASETRSRYCNISFFWKVSLWFKKTRTRNDSAVAHKSSRLDLSSGVLGFITTVSLK